MPEARSQRLLLLDLARTLALLGMVLFHTTYDLGMFGWLPPDTAFTGFFWYLARITAGSFIFLAGVGLWLSHGRGIRLPSFWRRLLKIAAAAALVSVATYFAMPEAWIFYGILHAIALSSLIGLAFLRVPSLPLLVIAVAVYALPGYWLDPSLPALLRWTGLTGIIPITADFEPFFPWFAPFLLGIVTARLFQRFDLWARLALPDTPLWRRLAWPGKHSLAIYLIHQPLLVGLVMAATAILR